MESTQKRVIYMGTCSNCLKSLTNWDSFWCDNETKITLCGSCWNEYRESGYDSPEEYVYDNTDWISYWGESRLHFGYVGTIVQEKDLITKVSKETGLKTRKVQKIIEKMFDIIWEELQSDRAVEILGFGKFQVRHRPSSDERIPAFKPDILLKKLINSPHKIESEGE